MNPYTQISIDEPVVSGATATAGFDQATPIPEDLTKALAEFGATVGVKETPKPGVRGSSDDGYYLNPTPEFAGLGRAERVILALRLHGVDSPEKAIELNTQRTVVQRWAGLPTEGEAIARGLKHRKVHSLFDDMIHKSKTIKVVLRHGGARPTKLYYLA